MTLKEVDRCLRLSKDCPITISAGDLGSSDAMLDAILSHVHRWRRVVIVVSPKSLQRIENALVKPLAHLEDLNIEVFKATRG